jgi:hypothetical protein
VEADDLGLYVLKFRGAGQGPLALVAELVAGEIGRMLGLPVPEIVFVEVDSMLGRNEPDQEIRDLLNASVGLNVGLDYLPGSVMFDPAAGDKATSNLASAAVWFDALVSNVDRTPQNPNLLLWHKTLHFIDHGAALYFHHNWPAANPHSSFPAIRQHVLLPWAKSIEDADAQLRPMLHRKLFEEVMSCVPEDWLSASREDYVQYFVERLSGRPAFVEEAVSAHAKLI